MDSPYGFPGYCDRLFDYNRLGAPLLGGSLTGAILTEDSAAYFAQATGSFGSLPWHLAVVLITVIILVTGSVTQIERANRVMMPVFFVLFTVLAVRVFFLPGASAGYNFLLCQSGKGCWT